MPETVDASNQRKVSLLERFRAVRACTETLCQPLATEDYVIQSMPDVSPAKWHLAHTTWFFETFLLKQYLKGYTVFNEHYNFLFNSYYNAIGERHARPKRGMLSRPTVEETYAYRHYVTEHVNLLVNLHDGVLPSQAATILELGINHEQQHQELILTDLKHVLFQHPIYPVYREDLIIPASAPSKLEWMPFEAGQYTIGHTEKSFAFDNEMPSHIQYLQSFALASRLVTNLEYQEFMADGGYRRPELWLSLGWSTVQTEQWDAPLYWVEEHDRWMQFTLQGLREITPHDPVTHLSYFEADAFARWKNLRLPTEAEWEIASSTVQLDGPFQESELFHPRSGEQASSHDLSQMFGVAWQWTQSSYNPYPGFAIADGALGEYNGKFMCNQYVLRGGSIATPKDHLRRTYRNFFPAEARWQFTGLRLAKDL